MVRTSKNKGKGACYHDAVFKGQASEAAAFQAENEAAFASWRKGAFGFGIFVGAIALATLYKEVAHHHTPHERPKYEHINIRHKPYPWGAETMFGVPGEKY